MAARTVEFVGVMLCAQSNLMTKARIIQSLCFYIDVGTTLRLFNNGKSSWHEVLRQQKKSQGQTQEKVLYEYRYRHCESTNTVIQEV